MRVEELASAHSVSVDTVRYYQKIGVLHPPVREGRAARYDTSHLRRLGEIRRLSQSGFSLAQIRRLGVGNDDPMLVALGAHSDDTLSFEELVRQSGLDPELVRLAVDTGLVRPVRATAAEAAANEGGGGAAEGTDLDSGPVAKGALYSNGALGMLRAAAELLGAEMPLDDLVGLALRHASNMEAVAADAVELFADRFADVPVAERADLAAHLIPLVTDLVAQHFRESLVEHATDRILAGGHDEPTAPDSQPSAGTRAPRRLTLECRELPEVLDPLAVYAAAEGSQRTYWSCPDDDFEYCAIGSAFEVNVPADPDRFTRAAEALSLLDVEVIGDSGIGEGLGLLAVGGFSFSDHQDGNGDSLWEAFGPGRLTVPELLVVRRGDRMWLTSVPDTDLGLVTQASRHSTRLANPQTGGADGDLNAAALAMVDASYRDDDRYVELTQRALERIAKGGLDKVVTARELCIAAPLEPIAVLDRLRRRSPSWVTFAFGLGPQTFFGATPERLVRCDGERFSADALAGSRPRHGDPARDAELKAELQRDPKELTEHAMVVTDVRDTLRAQGVTLDPPTPTAVMDLPHIRHLHTPITGRVPAGTTVLELAGALHPTAAVAGLPRRVAREWIAEHENFDRGWYAGAIGWTTLEGRGEFRVGLRCALTGPAETRLFAGGGIVAGADPQAELAETAVKLEALLFALDDSAPEEA